MTALAGGGRPGRPGTGSHVHPEAQPAPEAERASGARVLRELPVLFLIAVVIAYVVKTFVAQPFYIPSGSMLPQLHINDRVVVSKLSYRLHEPRRGDIVVFDAPAQQRGDDAGDRENPLGRLLRGIGEAIGVVQPSAEEYIKRVIAVPGETVEGRGGNVYVGGRLLLEPYLPRGTVTGEFPPTEVPTGHLWVMGDNRSNSSDSRVFGPIEQDSVVGRAVLRVWPPSRTSFL